MAAEFRITSRISSHEQEQAHFAQLLLLHNDLETLLEAVGEALPTLPCRCIDGTCTACRCHEVYTRRTGRQAFPADTTEYIEAPTY